ncbi:hypothetical protein GCM10009720_03790 [Yaniella flava]|uniref:Type II toxin-antitoxin system RelE/ParE family toxin n=1 Tax=Yaniella flava TaxID=287930 RepID=A0ABN2U3W3_9MICC
MTRRGGRHPEAEGTVVRLTDAAWGDLQTMLRKGDPQVVRWALKKCLLLERNPEAGKALRGKLIGFRKIVVGDRDWRLVWRATHDDSGTVVVDVAEVWALGARSDAEVYREVQDRVSQMRDDPATVPLAAAIDALGRAAYGLKASTEPDEKAAVPEWLVNTLVYVVKMPRHEIARLSPEQAQRIWNGYISNTSE